MSVLEAPGQVGGLIDGGRLVLTIAPSDTADEPASFPPLGHQFLANIRGGDIARECRGRWRHLSAGDARLELKSGRIRGRRTAGRPFRDSDRVPTSPPRITANFGRWWAPVAP